MLVHQVSSRKEYDKLYLEPRFPLRAAAKATSFSVNTLRSNYERDWFRSIANGMNVGRGRTQKLCLGDVLILAIAKRLIDIGVHPLEAHAAALPFGVVARQTKGLSKRLPFMLFNPEEFETLFVWRRGSMARIIPVPRKTGTDLTQLGLNDPAGEAMIILLLNGVEATVFEVLGVSAGNRPDGS